MHGTRTTFALILITAISLLVSFSLFSIEAVAQDPAYHRFIDARTLFAIPNCFNVISNLIFLIVGASGVYLLLVKNRLVILDELKSAYLILFTAVSLVAFGSGYYHLAPGNDTLLWDRLPMAIAFMALFTTLIAETISPSLARRLLYPLISAGVASVLYWHITEQAGAGDLRFYILVQFLPMLLMPIILLLFRSGFNTQRHYWFMLLAYITAKFLEYFDSEIYHATGVISGHSLKHIAAAIAVLLLLRGYMNRRRLSHETGHEIQQEQLPGYTD